MADILSPDGPHSPETTRQAAELAAEAARYLNYATGPHASQGLEYPNDVDAIVAELALAASRRQQLHAQLAAWLQNQSAAGKIGVDRGSVIEAVADACQWLARANDGEAAVQYALDQAHQVTAIMSGKESADGN